MVEKMDKTQKAPWLAMTLGGCCASRKDFVDPDDNESSRALRVNEESEVQICYEQPQPISQPIASPTIARPSTSHSTMSRHLSQWAAQGRDFATRASSRASVHTLALTRPHKTHPRPRPSISRPMDFRHTDSVDGIQSMLDDATMPVRRRRSFQPLELSIYLPDGRLSPLPDFEEDGWVKKPAQAVVRNRDSATDSISSGSGASDWLVQRKPVGSGSRRSSVQSVQSVQSSQSRPPSSTFSVLPFLLEEPEASADSNASSPALVRRSHTSSTLSSSRRVLSRLSSPSPSRARASTAPSSRPGSLRKFKVDRDPSSDEVDAAIRELNTIVEERRADAYRSANYGSRFDNLPPPSPSSHVPAIAPSLRMKVRSETLSDIGSAFSAPLVAKPLPTPPKPSSASKSLRLEPPKRTFSGPLDSNPITPPTPTIPGRLGAWLKRSLPPTPSSTSFKTASSTPSSFKSLKSPKSLKSLRSSKSSTTPTTSFYQCQHTPQQDVSQQYFDMESRPSSTSSRTITTTHSRHASNDTASATLYSSYPSTPSLTSHRSLSPTSDLDCPAIPATPASSTANHIPISSFKPTTTNASPRKTRRVPAPLLLSKEKSSDLRIEACLGSARSFQSMSSTRSSVSTSNNVRYSRDGHRRSLKPPPSPNYGILRGMEISAREEGVLRGGAAEMVLPSPGAVGVAF
ncbi:hypothetical protein DM02DRAFT_332781 [Periconia macrospinosa]|uniref:Uncharacterized protein n=1 Tax=Periconia macrospinosa TaxID=97972 RepID=A0A2V1DVF4_9PLEO|nr:hypothetical protein DM02DRAFT_332781 [Periconia macrospinosa]